MMTQDEVLKELRSVIATNQQFTTWTISTPHIVELVNRAIKQEREACAKVCDDWPNGRDDVYLIGVAIRARGNT
jgi:hypothetical protein